MLYLIQWNRKHYIINRFTVEADLSKSLKKKSHKLLKKKIPKILCPINLKSKKNSILHKVILPLSL